MKHSLPLIASLIGFVFNLHAQNDSLEFTVQSGYYTHFSCAKKEHPGDYYYTAFTATDSSEIALKPFVTKLAPDGNSIWQTEVFDTIYQTGEVNSLQQLYDYNLVISGYRQQCKAHQGRGYVQKIYRGNGTTAWIKSFTMDYGSGFGDAIVELPDSGFWLTNKNMLYRLNKDGDSLYFNSYNYGRINCILNTGINSFILGCKNGLIKIDSAGNVIDTLALPKPVKLITGITDSLYYFVSGKIVYKADSDLNIIAQDNSWLNSLEINKIEVENNLIWILLHPSANNISRLLKWDLDFNFVGYTDYTNYNGSDLDVRSFNINTQDYTLFVHERTNKLSDHLLLKNWEKANNTSQNFNTDIGVTSIYADSSYGDITQQGSKTIITPYFRINATIKNYGPVTVNRFYINSVLDTGLNVCLPHNYSKMFDGLNLQPGDSTTISIGTVRAEPYEILNNPMHERYLCFWTSSPNKMMDYDHANDNYCNILTVNNFTGSNDLELNTRPFIYPNPADDNLTLQFSKRAEGTCLLYNSKGTLVWHDKFGNSNFTIDVSNLTPGLYLLLIDNNRTIKSYKFVKK